MDRRKQNFLQKLYSREVCGTFFRGRPAVHNKAIKLFGGSIPNRLIFLLQDMFGSRSDHVLVGTSRCGQFLITYSFTVHTQHPVQLQYKYRLHWWAFHGASPAHKVAEVQLFDFQEITHPLHIGIAQWPNVNDKLIVYGYSDEYDHPYPDDAAMSELDSALANRKYYITVTTLPSLHNCRDCKAVAESFSLEEMVANMDLAVSFSCLKHGLTIHTTLDVAPPYPMFNANTSLKMDYKIIVNTGNFLHVLSFFPDKEVKTSTERETIVPDEISHRIGEMLSNRLKDYNCPWKKSGNTSSLSLMHRKSLSKSINNAWHNTIMDKANKVYAFEESEDGCEPRFKWYKKRRLADKMYEFCSDDEDMENKCPPAKIPRCKDSLMHDHSDDTNSQDMAKVAMMKLERKLAVSDSALDAKDGDRRHSCPLVSGDPGVSLVYPEGPIFFKSLLPGFRRGKSDHYDVSNKVSVSNNSVCDNEMSEKCDRTWDKPVSCESCDTNGAIPQQNPVDTDCNPAQIDLYSLTQLSLSGSDKSGKEEYKCDNLVSSSDIKQNSIDTHCKSPVINSCNKPSNTSVSSSSDNHSVSLTNESEAKPSDDDIPPLDISVINPDLSAILAEWEADSVSSLSPRSDSLSKNDVIQSFLELIPGMTISPRSSGNVPLSVTSENLNSKMTDTSYSATKVASPNSSSKYSPLLVVLRTRNCNQDLEPQKMKEQEDKVKGFSKEEVASKVAVKSTKEPDVSLRQRIISGCSVRFDRIYIELDDEIVSTISTDFEDDDQGTGFHCALPLSVHGSAYAQLQMVTSQKAERLSMDCERVFQTSFDIEQFCFKAADIICQCEGFKFWFCSDYDVELIDVCALNADILGVVCMRVNAEKKPPKNEMYTKVNQRHFYGVKCVFLWNPVADRCWLEAYSPLVESRQVGRAWEAPARREADRLRHLLQGASLFTLPPHPPIRTFEHRLWTRDMISPSIEELRDYKNLVGFRLFLRPPGRRRILQRYIAEFWD